MQGDVDGGGGALAGFAVYGRVDGLPCSAHWDDGWLRAEAIVVTRAEIVVALGEQSPGPRPMRASLDGDALAALFTVTRAFSEVEYVHLGRDVGSGEAPGGSRAELERWLALVFADPFDLPQVVVPVPSHLDATTTPLVACGLEEIQVNADVVVDMSTVSVCTTAAVEMLDAAGRRFTGAGGSFRLRTPSAAFLRLAHTYGMAHWFVFDAAPDAGRSEN